MFINVKNQIRVRASKTKPSWLMESIKIRILAKDEFSPSTIFCQCIVFSFY